MDACAESLHRIQQDAMAGPRKIRCDAPAPTSTIDTIQNDQWAAVSKAHLELAVLALQCGLTNVVTRQYAEDQNFVSVFGGVEGVSSSASQHEGSHANDAVYLAMQRWYSGQCAYLLERLVEAGSSIAPSCSVPSTGRGRPSGTAPFARTSLREAARR